MGINYQVCVAFTFIAAVMLPNAWCDRHDTAIQFYFAEGHHFSTSERRAIQTIADATTAEVRRHLPSLPRDLVLKVQAGRNVIPETGETGYASPPNIVYWTVDPNSRGGVTAIARSHLRPSLFEFFYHLVRHQTAPSSLLMDQVVSDGLAIVFVRDFAGISPPWGVYPDHVSEWAHELMALPAMTALDHFDSDQRRWITFQTGTYLVDRAMRSSGQSSVQLVSRSTDDVIRMAFQR